MIGYKSWAIPEGNVVKVTDESGAVIWAVQSGDKVILQVEKITSNTYAGETTYENEEFILLDIYPKTNGTVKVTYGGLTKTITDTSGVEEPNAQQVFFGTFNGVSDSVATPASGELTIKGDYYAFGCSTYKHDKMLTYNSSCICSFSDFGKADRIPPHAFGYTSPSVGKFNQTSITIPSTIKRIGSAAFYGCSSLLNVEMVEGGVEYIEDYAFYGCDSLTSVTVPESVAFIEVNAFATIENIKMLASTPPELEVQSNGYAENYAAFGDKSVATFSLEQIIVPKGCRNTYKSATGWKIYSEYIVEES